MVVRLLSLEALGGLSYYFMAQWRGRYMTLGEIFRTSFPSGAALSVSGWWYVDHNEPEWSPLLGK
ncbi:hypothetical protein, partial [Arthrobacter sp. Bz4]|uniref:hypothetical protein n=1 Tax=Arthrobacter sp. Bz4 TaxID=2171979 RepID=UPI001A9C9042